MKEKPRLVLLHGWTQSQETKLKWQPLIDQLEKSGYQTQYLRLPGLSADLNQVWNLNDYCDWLEQQLEDTSEVILVGHSFGGQIAARTASRNLKSLKALVLIGPAGIIDQRWFKVIKRNLFKLLAKIGNFFFRNVSDDHLFKKILYKLAREKDYLQASAQLKQTMKLVLKDEILEDLEMITVPTLIIWGEEDKATPVHLSKIFKAKIEQSQLVILPGENHCPHYHQPSRISQIITNFISTYVN